MEFIRLMFLTIKCTLYSINILCYIYVCNEMYSSYDIYNNANNYTYNDDNWKELDNTTIYLGKIISFYLVFIIFSKIVIDNINVHYNKYKYLSNNYYTLTTKYNKLSNNYNTTKQELSVIINKYTESDNKYIQTNKNINILLDNYNIMYNSKKELLDRMVNNYLVELNNTDKNNILREERKINREILKHIDIPTKINRKRKNTY